MSQYMNYRIDNLQYCNWSRKVFQINKDAGLDAVHVTLVYHEDYDEFLIKLNDWYKLFDDNSDLTDQTGYELSYSYNVNDYVTTTAGFFSVEEDNTEEDDTGVVLETAFSF